MLTMRLLLSELQPLQKQHGAAGAERAEPSSWAQSPGHHCCWPPPGTALQSRRSGGGKQQQQPLPLTPSQPLRLLHLMPRASKLLPGRLWWIRHKYIDRSQA